MSRVIAAAPHLSIRRGDDIIVAAGEYAGESGLVVTIFRGVATVARDDDRWFTVPIADCETNEAADVTSGLDTTHQTA